MTVEPTKADWARAEEITRGFVPRGTARLAVAEGAAQALADERERARETFCDLADRLEMDAKTDEYAGGHYARDVLTDVAVRIRRLRLVVEDRGPR